MFSILSIGSLLVVLLIAYWWGNQGAFDALVHLIAVIVAGALAFALWEPVTHAFLLTPALSEFGWGLSLGVLFLALLAILRIVIDKLCPVRPRLARWADWAFGSLMGVWSGVLTVGMILIAVGHVATARDLAGHENWKRDAGSPGPIASNGDAPASVCVSATAGFYKLVSDGGFAPWLGAGSLATLRPDVGADADSLMRDSVDGGKGRVAVTPAGLSVSGFYRDPSFAIKTGGPGAFAVLINPKSPSFDSSGGFSLAASQAHLIDASTGTSVFPVEFSQREAKSGDSLVRYSFAGDANYLTTASSSAESVACLLFPSKPFGESKGPFYLQIKGLRYELPNPTPGPEGLAKAVQSGGKTIAVAAAGEDVPVIPENQLRVDAGVQGVLIDKNNMPGSLKEDGNLLIGGAAERISKADATSGDVRFIKETEGSRILRLVCSRDTVVDLFNTDRTRKDAERVGPNGQPVLIDATGNIYAPVGYIWRDEQRDEFEIYLDEEPKEGLTLKRFARAANSGEIFILYRVPIGVTVKTVALRDPNRSMADARIVGKADIAVEAGAKKAR
ncbi:MAG: CvpA family protein [Planctomycetes bacterium]|nr:CvpA family protein [Planctomycetota bacterium]